MAVYLTEANVKGFKKCCISNAVDGTDDMLLYVSEDGHFRCKCEEDEGTDCEYGEVTMMVNIDRI